MLLEACRWAPSGGNRQPWHVVVVTDRRTLELIKGFSPGILGDQPSLILAIFADRPTRETAMDVAMAAENIWLAATAIGLGVCAIGSFNKAAVAEILEAPPELEPLLLIAAGFPRENPEPRPRKAIEQFASLNRYGKPLVL